MDDMIIATHFENIDRRLGRIEQILPTLATNDELKTLATKRDLQTAVARLATREELREEGERSRRYMTMLIEHQNSKLDLLAEHVLSLTEKRTEE
jgi:hypothetical protein